MRDVAAMEAALAPFDGVAGGRMQLRVIGTTASGRSIYAVHISEHANFVGTELEESAADKPALLVECGTHAREWAAPELCLKFLQSFSLGFLFTPTRINDILAHADVWVIPMVNPDGRCRRRLPPAAIRPAIGRAPSITAAIPPDGATTRSRSTVSLTALWLQLGHRHRAAISPPGGAAPIRHARATSSAATRRSRPARRRRSAVSSTTG